MLHLTIPYIFVFVTVLNVRYAWNYFLCSISIQAIFKILHPFTFKDNLHVFLEDMFPRGYPSRLKITEYHLSKSVTILLETCKSIIFFFPSIRQHSHHSSTCQRIS